VTRHWKLLAGALWLALLAGCPLPPRAPAPPPLAPAGAPAPPGAPYQIVAADSLLTILVYRAGPLASVGHNHVIASHELAGTIYVPSEITHSTFEMHVPVATLTVDETALREQQASADFPPDLSDSAREGTRHNMLGEALLDAANHPEIVLQATPLPAAAPAGTVLAQVRSTVRAEVRTFTAPVRYELSDHSVTVSGEMTLRQSELGLTPFSALLGALQVQDEMRVSFRIVARAAAAH
jgi:polyisoprenoid-binding protein YceI